MYLLTKKKLKSSQLTDFEACIVVYIYLLLCFTYIKQFHFKDSMSRILGLSLVICAHTHQKYTQHYLM